MVKVIIEIAFDAVLKALKKKKGKVYEFLIRQETQNTMADINRYYVEAVEELEDEEEGGAQ